MNYEEELERLEKEQVRLRQEMRREFPRFVFGCTLIVIIYWICK